MNINISMLRDPEYRFREAANPLTIIWIRGHDAAVLGENYKRASDGFTGEQLKAFNAGWDIGSMKNG